jgi:hypothetical protein
MASAEMGIVELERCEADGEDVALVLAVWLIELVAELYRRVAHYGREDGEQSRKRFGASRRSQIGPRD